MLIKLDDDIPFGKHKGCSAKTIAQIHYNYILWAEKNVTYHKFSEHVLYIARKEKNRAEIRQIAYAYGLQQPKRLDWDDFTEDTILPYKLEKEILYPYEYHNDSIEDLAEW